MFLNNNLQLIATNCPNLECIKYTGCCYDNDLIQFSLHCPQLQHIEMGQTGDCTDVGVIAEGCRQLQTFRFDQTSLGQDVGITDNSIIKATELCPLLENLSFQGIRKLTDESLVAIGHNCKHLKKINLFWFFVSEAGFISLFSSPNMNDLTHIEINQVPAFTDDVMFELVKMHTHH